MPYLSSLETDGVVSTAVVRQSAASDFSNFLDGSILPFCISAGVGADMTTAAEIQCHLALLLVRHVNLICG